MDKDSFYPLTSCAGKVSNSNYSDDPYIFNPSALTELKSKGSLPINYNIYFITKTNRAFFHPDGFIIDRVNNIAKGYFIRMEQFNRNIFPLELNIPEEVASIEVAPFPHKFIVFKDSNGEEIKAANIYNILLDTSAIFEVLYIGRSYGRKKQLNIIDRLYNQNHKTFKQILIDISESEPDQEPFIMAFNFMHMKKIFSTGFEYFKSTFEREIDRIKEFDKMVIPRQKEVLINYFRPRYNDLLKHSLNSMHTKAAHFFANIDISGLAIEFATKDTKAMLFSDIVSPKQIHLIQVPVLKDINRLHFFNGSEMNSSRSMNIDYLLDT